MKTSHKLSWQQGVVAQFAEIDLVIKQRFSGKIGLTLPDNVLSEWADAIRFGVTLFRNSYASKNPAIGNMLVQVRAINGVPSDTTTCALAYVTFQSLCSAWNIDGEQLFAFDRSTGNYSFRYSTLWGEWKPTPSADVV